MDVPFLRRIWPEICAPVAPARVSWARKAGAEAFARASSARTAVQQAGGEVDGQEDEQAQDHGGGHPGGQTEGLAHDGVDPGECPLGGVHRAVLEAEEWSRRQIAALLPDGGSKGVGRGGRERRRWQ